MTANGLHPLDRFLVYGRLVLSSCAALLVVANWSEHWLPLTTPLEAVLLAHLAFSIHALSSLGGGRAQQAGAWVWIDALFAAVISACAMGDWKPALPFWAFALYGVSLRGSASRAVSIVDAGWQLHAARQREQIARELHDGSAQALALVDLRLEKCRRLLHREATGEAAEQLADLQQSVRREHDALRAFARALAGVERTAAAPLASPQTTLHLSAEVSGSIELVDQILGIARESLHNLRRHAAASRAEIAIRGDRSAVSIEIVDDGVGFRDESMPWSIASRVREVGGQIQVRADRPGAHLSITLPGN